MLSIREASRRILRKVRPGKPRWIPSEKAAGLILAETVRAKTALPPFDNSAMDGYAVRSSDLRTAPARLRLLGTSAAGRPFPRKVRFGECVRIFTGAAIPAGADAVVIQEVCRKRGAKVEVRERPSVGENIRRKGEEIRRGEAVLAAGTKLSPAALALAIAAGRRKLLCRPRPKIGVLSTGNELRPPGSRLRAGEIPDANRPMILARARAAGAEPVDLGIAADRLSEIRRRIRSGLRRCDAVVTIGGASVGEKDFVREAFRREGLRLEFWKVAMRPGKPFAFARRRRTYGFALPGNPSSSLVSFILFVEPAIRKMAGRGSAENRWIRIPLLSAVERHPSRDRLVWCRLLRHKNRLAARPLPGQASHMFTGMANGEALARIPAGKGRIPAERLIDVLVLSGADS